MTRGEEREKNEKGKLEKKEMTNRKKRIRILEKYHVMR